MKKLFLAAALSALTFSAAQAADAVVYEPVSEAPIAASFDWTGAYIGAHVGYGWADVDRLAITGIANSYDANGFLAGVHIGYNHQIDQFVVGIEGDIEWADLDGDDNGFGGTVDETDFNWTGSVRARLGYAFDRLLVYGTGGIAFASIDQNNIGGVPESIKKTYTGWTVGAGAEYAFTDNLTTRIEYRYSDFGTKYFAPAGLNSFENDITSHSVRLGISYRF
ncbi:outer membrane protein [Aquamicrobium ahrensii]|uniref:Outer membrane immunogenic protein n=1 Tax=Aquamicrobium ahrensii TaxID=469551 RepID=A0ABV2KN89_9HYPH